MGWSDDRIYWRRALVGDCVEGRSNQGTPTPDPDAGVPIRVSRRQAFDSTTENSRPTAARD